MNFDASNKGQIFSGLIFILLCSASSAQSKDYSVALEPAQKLLAKKEFSAAFALYHRHAKDKNPLAQFSLGLFYKLGWGGIDKNTKKACAWFYQASQGEVPFAQKEMGDCTALHAYIPDTNNIPKQPEYWYRKAYDNGIHEAACDIGRLYLGTKWRAKDINKAIQWCKLAAEKSALSAQVTLGDIYASSKLQHYNPKNAEFWYQQAANRNSGIAAYRLAELYISIAQTLKNSNGLYSRALVMMEKSSSLKYIPAYPRTAQLYWQKLNSGDGDVSTHLAKSYLWAKASYLVKPNDVNQKFLRLITQEVPTSWLRELDDKVDAFLN